MFLLQFLVSVFRHEHSPQLSLYLAQVSHVLMADHDDRLACDWISVSLCKHATVPCFWPIFLFGVVCMYVCTCAHVHHTRQYHVSGPFSCLECVCVHLHMHAIYQYMPSSYTHTCACIYIMLHPHMHVYNLRTYAKKFFSLNTHPDSSNLGTRKMRNTRTEICFVSLDKVV